MTGLLAEHGVLLVFVNVLLAQVGLPLPAVPLLIVAGALVQSGELTLPVLLGVAVVGSLLGDIPWYFAGRRYGYSILKTLCRVAMEPDICVKQTENIYERWGAPSLVVAKLIPGFATVAPPLAGTMRLPFLPFVVYSALSAAIWAGIALGAGMLFHTEVEAALKWLQEMGTGALTALTGIIALYVAVKWVERWLFIRALRMARISVDELHEMIQRGAQPIILDVRSESARRLDPRRIPGALAVDITAPELALAQVAADREIVVYCT
ncbi:MAG TPA: VTT domain-containing protein [Burkholderiales bacterium]|nr:VTT domain-containing protein [Burkholderiales bacterium]